jgi:hypothetical protein
LIKQHIESNQGIYDTNLSENELLSFFSDFGKNPSISDFLSCQITIRKSTGALIQCALPIYYELCLDLLFANRAEEALQLCQYIAVKIHPKISLPI